ncbi:hypothetical protein FRC09_001743 [Ceratobasidium sp. 395]|nr:hypothetical protein FRC09_001743 [Ceratobasidium sp. 395]
MPSLPIPSFLAHSGHLAESFPSSEEEHTDQWVSVSRAPLLAGVNDRRNRTNSTGSSSEHWHRQDSSMFFGPAAQSSPVRPQLSFEIEPEAESSSWARNVESRLAGLAPITPKRNTRSRSVDELGRYPSVRDRVAEVHERSRSQADLIVRSPKNKQAGKKGEKLPTIQSHNSISRRASAPLLGSSGSKKQLKPIDTTRPYVRSGITPPGTAKPLTPTGQLSTFGTVYVPGWNSSRAEDIPRPSTAPLPSYDFGFREFALAYPETDEELGGVYYSTYGSRTSQIYEGDPFSDTPPANTPFASAAVPIPASLLATEPEEKGHRKSGSQPLVLAAALLRKVGREGSGPPSPAVSESQTRRARTGSSGPGTPREDSIARPTTPAVPDFLVASRSVAGGGEEEGLVEARAESPKPKLKTRASLLSITALASRQNSGSGSGSLASVSAGHNSDSAHASSNGQAQAQAQPRPRQPTSPSSPRPRSALMRLAARFIPTDPGYTTAQTDESFVTVDESITSADGILPDSDQSKNKNVLDEMEIGHSTPIVELGAFPTSPIPEPTPKSPTYTRNRTWSKLSATSRRVFERPLSGTFSGFSNSSKRQSVASSSKFDEFGSPRGRVESLTRRPSADMLSSEGAIEGTVMYGVGEEMLRLMFGGAAPVTPAPTSPSSNHEHPSRSSNPIRNRSSSRPQQAPSPRERTRSLPRRVSPPRGDLAAMLFPPPRDVSAEHEAHEGPVDIGLLPDFGGALDLRFSNPANNANPTTLLSAANSPTPLSSSSSSAQPPRRPSSSQPPRRRPSSSGPAPRRKGHRRGMSSKENERTVTRPRVAVKSRSRSKSAPLGLSAELQKSWADQQPPPIIKPGILMNGNTNMSRPAVVVVNSATTPSNGTTPRKRQPTRSSPMPVQREGAGSGDELGELPDTSTVVRASSQRQPGVIVTAPTPPGPRRSLSMPLDRSSPRSSGPPLTPADTTRGSVSRGTSVQFVETVEGARRSRRKEMSAATSSTGEGEANGNGKGKRKVEREGTDAADPGRSSPSKKPRLGGEDVDITFMGEPLFGGVPQIKRGRGSVDRASSHHSVRIYHPTPGYPYSKSPSPAETPDPERASIPMRAIMTPRVQSLYGAPPASDYVVRRQSAGDIPRPKSRSSMRSIPRPKSQASARSYATGGAKSNMTSARSHVTGARSNVTGARSNVSRATTQIKLKDRLPLQGWCFVFGFFIPFVWWYAAFTRAERGYYGGGVWSRDVETQWEGVKTRKTDYRDRGRVDAHTWRFRCRLAAVCSLVIYIPVIVLAAVFAR